MARVKRLLPHLIAKRVKQSPLDKTVFVGQLLPVEVEYVCRRSGERNGRLDTKRAKAAAFRKKGLAVWIPISFKANYTFAKELASLVKG
jgi:hypothetical protein